MILRLHDLQVQSTCRGDSVWASLCAMYMTYMEDTLMMLLGLSCSHGGIHELRCRLRPQGRCRVLTRSIRARKRTTSPRIILTASIRPGLVGTVGSLDTFSCCASGFRVDSRCISTMQAVQKLFSG